MTNNNESLNPGALTTGDIVTMGEILQLVTSRGAIRAEEMMVVGTLYNKINAFLKMHRATAPQPDTNSKSDSDTPDTPNNDDPKEKIKTFLKMQQAGAARPESDSVHESADAPNNKNKSKENK